MDNIKFYEMLRAIKNMNLGELYWIDLFITKFEYELDFDGPQLITLKSILKDEIYIKMKNLFNKEYR